MSTDIDAQADSTTPPRADDTQRIDPPAAGRRTAGPPRWADWRTRFRFPTPDDPRPPARRLLAMALYASVVGLGALAGTVQGLLAIVGGSTPWWYPLAFATPALLCVALVVGALLAIHHRRLSWALLLAATPTLAIMIAVTTAVD